MALPNIGFFFRSANGDDRGGDRPERRSVIRRTGNSHSRVPPESPAESPTEARAAERHDRDAAWVIRLQHDDAEAFTAVFRAYYATLVRFVRRYVANVSDAEDVAQETMVQLWERRMALDPARSLQAFLLTSGRNRALDVRRKDRRIATHADHLQARYASGHLSATEHSVEDEVLADELHQFAAHHISQLPPRQRDIFHLSREEGLSPSEIGEILGIATQTVYVQLSRITKTLYTALAAWTRDK
jgi:RNA polymerase sigma-70 factor (ECF subfamily)